MCQLDDLRRFHIERSGYTLRVYSAVAAAEAAIIASFQECSDRNVWMLFYGNHLATWRRYARFLSSTFFDFLLALDEQILSLWPLQRCRLIRFHF